MKKKLGRELDIDLYLNPTPSFPIIGHISFVLSQTSLVLNMIIDKNT